MASFLFWNLYGQQQQNLARRTAAVREILTRLIARHQLDVLIFAECDIPEGELRASLDQAGCGTYRCPPARSERIRIWTRHPESTLEDRFNDGTSNRLTIREFRPQGQPGIMLAACHFHDRITLPTELDRAMVMQEMADAIQKVEDRVGHQRTVLVGDLNMNPFEGGVVGSTALHGVMTRELASSVPRMPTRSAYRCFYNPMWGFFGDRTPGPPGTYFFNPGLVPTNHFWNMYDQVLLRPDLMNNLKQLEILTTDGTESFLTRNGRPRRGLVSDHLPIFFVLGD